MNDDVDKDSRRPRYVLYTFLIIIILLLILLLFLYLIRSPLIFRSGAYSVTTATTGTVPATSTSLSLDNSYVFASPLRAKIGGESIRITVYVLDSRGLGIPGKQVSINTGNALTVAPIQPVTDGQGRAIFDVSSVTSTGAYDIQASSDGVTLTQKATISFD
jgi:hypothetical protein